MPISDKNSPLLHVCCAPCCGPVIERMLEQGLSPTIFFYNPNIYPKKEYEYRKSSVIIFARKLSVPIIDADYDTDNWLNRTKGLEDEPERGRRCSSCFDMRLERTAQHAHENGFSLFATTNGIGRWKDINQVNKSGQLAASRYPGLTFMGVNWKELAGVERINFIAKRERFYKQQYCGCVFSLKERNRQQETRGFPPVQHGVTYYGS